MIRLILSSLRSHAKQMVSAVVILSLSLFLIMQQMSTFQKVMSTTYGLAAEMRDVDVWVMAPAEALMKIKSLECVAAAAPFYKGTSFIKGRKWTIIGVDEFSLLGLPHNLKAGKIAHLSLEGAVLVNQKKSRLKVGNVLPIGKTKAVVVGLYNSSKEPVIYTTLDRAPQMSQLETGDLPFLLVKAKEGVSPSALCQKIKRATGLKAFTKRDFIKMVTTSYLQTSGIPSHFAWAIIVGFVLALGIICTTLISVCERLGRDLTLFHTIGAPFSVLLTLALVHCMSVSLLAFLSSFLFSTFFFFSWKVVGITLAVIVWMGIIIPLVSTRSYDRMYSSQ